MRPVRLFPFFFWGSWSIVAFSPGRPEASVIYLARPTSATIFVSEVFSSGVERG